ncbi:MAG: type II secretion system F family protein [Flavobacteriales bacterium]|nr:type II secretion system F family protein [Flavobacteriales bacterium]
MAIPIHTEAKARRVLPTAAKPPWGHRVRSWWAAQGAQVPNDVRKERLYRELSVLLQAGVDPRSVLDLLVKAQTDAQLRKVLEALRGHVLRGSTLSEAMAAEPAFTDHERFSVRIGEESGRTTEVFLQLARYYADRVKLKRLVRQAFAYPLFVLAVTMGVVLFMMNVIVPMFAQVFARTGSELPALTRLVLRVAAAFQLLWPYMLASLVTATVIVLRVRKRADVQAVTERVLWRLPVLGPMRRRTLLARVCGSMAFLLQAGTPLDKALELTGRMCGSPRLARAFADIRQRVVRGGSLRDGLAAHAEFDAQLVAMVGVAEEVKQLDRMFERLAEAYTADVQHRTALLGSVLEPATILVIAVLVGTVLVAMYLPMFKLSTAM